MVAAALTAVGLILTAGYVLFVYLWVAYLQVTNLVNFAGSHLGDFLLHTIPPALMQVALIVAFLYLRLKVQEAFSSDPKSHRVVLPQQARPLQIYNVIEALKRLGLNTRTEMDEETVILHLTRNGQPGRLGWQQKQLIRRMPGGARIEDDR